MSNADLIRRLREKAKEYADFLTSSNGFEIVPEELIEHEAADALAAHGWSFDMDAAPRDGTAVWLFGDFGIALGYFDPEGFDGGTWLTKASFERRERQPDRIFGTYAYDLTPTAWMPLPAPPDTPGRSEG